MTTISADSEIHDEAPAHGMTNPKMYDVRLCHVDRNGRDTGGYNHGCRLNEVPMTLKQACTFKSKMVDRPRIAYRITTAA